MDLLETKRACKERTSDLHVDDAFVYSAHADELIVGHVFVRIFNEQPSYQIDVPLRFANDLLSYLTKQYDDLRQLENIAYSLTIEDCLKHSVMSLDALCHLIRNNVGVESSCIGHFRLLFGLLNVSHGAIQKGALNVIAIVTRSNECVNDIANADILGYLLLLLYTLQDYQSQILDTLHALMTTTKIVKEMLNKGGVVYLLDLFCNSTSQQVRELCAELMARMCADKLIGPKVKLTLGNFLPPIFADAMRDNPQTSVNMFESIHEHPELIWDQDAKDRVCSTIAKMRRE